MHGKNIAPHYLGSRGYSGKEPIWEREDTERVGTNPYDVFEDPQARKFIRARYKKDPISGQLVTNAKVKDLEQKLAEEQQAHAQAQFEGSSTQVLGPWDNPFHRAYNTVNNVSPSKGPHRGRVVGDDSGQEHAFYYPETKEERKERKSSVEASLRKELATVKDNIPVQVQDTVAKTINAILPTLCETIGNWFEGGRQGPFPMISLGSSNSINVQPVVQNAATNTNLDHMPSTNPTPAPSQVGNVPRSSPSITCTPAAVRGLSPLEELNALTVITCVATSH